MPRAKKVPPTLVRKLANGDMVATELQSQPPEKHDRDVEVVAPKGMGRGRGKKVTAIAAPEETAAEAVSQKGVLPSDVPKLNGEATVEKAKVSHGAQHSDENPQMPKEKATKTAKSRSKNAASAKAGKRGKVTDVEITAVLEENVANVEDEPAAAQETKPSKGKGRKKKETIPAPVVVDVAPKASSKSTKKEAAQPDVAMETVPGEAATKQKGRKKKEPTSAPIAEEVSLKASAKVPPKQEVVKAAGSIATEQEETATVSKKRKENTKSARGKGKKAAAVDPEQQSEVNIEQQTPAAVAVKEESPRKKSKKDHDQLKTQKVPLSPETVGKGRGEIINVVLDEEIDKLIKQPKEEVPKPTTSVYVEKKQRGGRKRAAATATDDVANKSDDDGDSKRTLKLRPSKSKKAAPMNATETIYSKEDFDDKLKNKGPFDLKISSWNVAGLRSWVGKGGLKFLEYEKPDILCVQEIKCTVDQLPEEAARINGYHPYWLCMPGGYAGVGIYSKIMPINVEYGIGDAKFDEAGRMITAEYEKFFLINVYVPNSGRKLVNLESRMRWEKLFQQHVQKLNTIKPVVIAGDMNVSHQEIDLANPKSNTRSAGFTKEEREKMTELLSLGYVDTFRELYPQLKGAYTYWTYMGNARSRNVGWRLDYFIVSQRLLPRVVDNCIRNQCKGSDHCPITLLLKLK